MQILKKTIYQPGTREYHTGGYIFRKVFRAHKKRKFIVRTGVSSLIKEEFLLAQIDECRDGNSTLHEIETTEYDLVILDISMPGNDSISLLKKIFALRPDLKVLILTISSEDIYAKKYLQ